jgi:hypothetical protein
MDTDSYSSCPGIEIVSYKCALAAFIQPAFPV